MNCTHQSNSDLMTVQYFSLGRTNGADETLIVALLVTIRVFGFVRCTTLPGSPDCSNPGVAGHWI
jgi:hypothetical protein